MRDTKSDGVKEDKSKKPRWDLIRFRTIGLAAKIMAFGDGKHQDTNGWAKLSIDVHFASMMRHIESWRSGEIYDTGQGGSGEHHLSHALCRLMFILAIEIGDVPKEFDVDKEVY